MLNWKFSFWHSFFFFFFPSRNFNKNIGNKCFFSPCYCNSYTMKVAFYTKLFTNYLIPFGWGQFFINIQPHLSNEHSLFYNWCDLSCIFFFFFFERDCHACFSQIENECFKRIICVVQMMIISFDWDCLNFPLRINSLPLNSTSYN